MAIFSKKTKKTDAATTAVAQAKAVLPVNLESVLLRPRITEKGTDKIAQGAYVFDVDVRATKQSIQAAIKKTYNVTARKVAIVNNKAKVVRNARTGKYGTTTGSKKAYVYLKKGETITVM
jgi:ribosomal protein L23